MKKKITTLLASVALTVNAFAQIPTNGLIGWYPFNGNANDESINTNDGTVNGATLSIDRFGNSNKAYNFNGISDYIAIPNVAVQGSSDRTISFWVKTNFQGSGSMVVSTGTDVNVNGGNFNLRLENQNRFIGFMGGNFTAGGYDYYPTGTTILNDNQWHHVLVTFSSGNLKFYVDGVLENTVAKNISTVGQANFIGRSNHGGGNEAWFNGLIDDVGFWDRALNSSEVTNVFNDTPAPPCTDTIHITVTDTLIINRNTTSLNPLTYENTIKLFPNPTNDVLNIDYGSNFSTMNGFTLKITNSLNQTVYTTPINTQTGNVNISAWSNGIYFVHLLDASSNIIDIRKIILQ